jgi:anaphase-promoting complex subunit 8
MWTALATVYEALHRLPEAIESHTRALLGADRAQTTSILYKLANLHTSMAEAQAAPGSGPTTSALSSEATGYHRKIIALGESEGLGVSDLSASYLSVAEWEMAGQGSVQGDWGLASQYLEKVASTNAPQRDKAEGMLRTLRLREARLAAGHL